MRNSRKSTVILLIFATLIVVGLFFVFDKYLDKGKNNVKSNDSEISRILARKKTSYNIFSIDVGDTSKQNNLSELLGITSYDGIVANENISKVTYVKKTDSEVSLWKADSDGSNQIKVFQTNNTDCNGLSLLGISKDGKALLFSYIPYVESEIGHCEPKSKPQMTDEGAFYLKDGSSPVKIQDYVEGTFLGFYGKDILFSAGKDRYKIVSVWKMNPETMKSTKLFDAPQKLLWGDFTIVLLNPDTNMAVFNIAASERNDSVSKSEITLFDYKKNTFETIGSGKFAEYQGTIPSPNFKNIIYVHQIYGPGWESIGFPETDYYVYNVQTKKSHLLVFPGKMPRESVSIIWKNDMSFFYIVHPNDYTYEGNLKLFNLTDFTSTESIGLFLELVKFSITP